jgi:hypothetical protein
MAQNVSLARVNYQTHHSNMYSIGPYQTNKRAPNFNQWVIQFGLLALDDSNIFGKCTNHDWSCAISFQVVGCLC